MNLNRSYLVVLTLVELKNVTCANSNTGGATYESQGAYTKKISQGCLGPTNDLFAIFLSLLSHVIYGNQGLELFCWCTYGGLEEHRRPTGAGRSLQRPTHGEAHLEANI